MNIRERLMQWATYRQTARSLEQLDNHLLNDLGLTRGDIQRVARGHARPLRQP